MRVELLCERLGQLSSSERSRFAGALETVLASVEKLRLRLASRGKAHRFTEGRSDMRVRDIVARRIVEKTLLRSMTGRPNDLRRLLAAAQRIGDNEVRSFLNMFSGDSSTQTGFAQLFLRLGREASYRSKRKLLKNLICNWGLEGLRIRESLKEKGLHAPSHIVISPTMRCNMHCRGCYSGLYTKDGQLSEEEIEKVLREARQIGSYFVVVSGGEPYLMKDTWMRLWKKHPDMYFMTYTNGTLLDQRTVDELARLGNVAPRSAWRDTRRRRIAGGGTEYLRSCASR